MGYIFGVDDLKVATWNSAENYGTATDVDAVSLMSVTLNTVSGILEGDDMIKDAHAKIISATVRVRLAFSSLTVYSILTGTDVTDSATVDRLPFDTENLPYFALAGRMLPTEGSGDIHFFLPKVKLMEGFEIAAEYGRYATPELSMTAVREGTTYKLFNIYEHATAQAVTIPPT